MNTFYYTCTLLVFLLFVTAPAITQETINTIGSDSGNPANLDEKTSARGVLFPRLSTAQRLLIASPVTGLLVYDTETKSYWYKDSATWVELSSGTNSGNSDANPVGTILPFGGITPPSGYLECDGSIISRAAYSDLFAVIGTEWGDADGSRNFKLPDLNGGLNKEVNQKASLVPAGNSFSPAFHASGNGATDHFIPAFPKNSNENNGQTSNVKYIIKY